MMLARWLLRGIHAHRRIWTPYSALVLAVLTVSCGGLSNPAQQNSGWRREMQRDQKHQQQQIPNRDINRILMEESQQVAIRQEQLRQNLEQLAPAANIMPIMPQYDRLADIPVTLEMDNENARHVLSALAKQTDMNLLLHPDVISDAPNVSISFKEVPASTVFREILRISDLYGRIENNMLRVDAKQEMVIALDFLETNTTTGFSVGGDVLGTNQESGGALSGRFDIKGEGPKVSNPYDQLDSILKGLTGEGETYQVNRQTGTLYIKAKPSTVATISGLVNRYKKILGRQVLIEARIMEVSLKDGYKAGINWSLLRSGMSLNNLIGLTTKDTAESAFNVNKSLVENANSLIISKAASTTLSSMSGLGLGIAGNQGLFFMDLLKQFGSVRVLSNPTIRARHGQPAMISVGQSESYIKQVTTTTDTETNTKDSTVETAVTFDGLMVGVVPFITSEQRITLTIHPIQSSVEDGSLVPQTFGNTSISLPKVNLKEISTSLELRDQDTVLLGGLIDKVRDQTRSGVPVLSEIPILGNLFTHNTESEKVSELVLMLRVSIL